MTSVHRVLVVEDHEPFRRVLCELLRQRPDVLIVGEAADGLGAIRQAEELRPDMVMLDIGLPLLSGIEAAERMRTVVPEARFMFVTNETSLEVVELAFRRGAHGYVYKPRTHRDVLPVFEAIMRGGRFVSGGLERIARGDSLASHHHQLLFYSSDAAVVGAYSRFIARQLHDGNSVIVLVTDAHEASIRRTLRESHVDLAMAIRQERYIPVNISELLASVTVDGWPERARFQKEAEDLVAAAAGRVSDRRGRVTACGECAPTLWAQGHLAAAVQLEHLWDELASSHQMDTLCAYPLIARQESRESVTRLCAEHTDVEIS